MAAFVLGLVQFAAPKGTLPHRTLGWLWAGLMYTVAISGFFIHEIRLWGPWSPIHFLTLPTLILVPVALWQARKHRARSHGFHMLGVFVGGLVLTGALAFLPGRIMAEVLLGG